MASTNCSSTDALSFIAQSQIGGIFQAKITEGFPLLYANEYYYQLHGYTRYEFEKKFNNFAAGLVLPEDIGHVSQQVMQAIEEKQESISLEYRVRRGDGKTSWLHASAGITSTEAGFLLSGMVMNIDEQKNFEQQLLWSEKRFKIAIEHTRINVWEYDLRTRSIFQTEKPFQAFGNGTTIPNVPESQIQKKVIHPDDAAKYAALYDKLHSGAETADAVVRILSTDGKYYWEKINYTNLFENGKPVRAVAVSEDISPQKEAEQHYFHEEYLREMLSADMLFSVKINFSLDHIMHIWSEYYKNDELQKIKNYRQLTKQVAGFLANRGDQKRYLEQFSPAALTRALNEGQTSLYGEYRCSITGGHILWCAFRLAIMQDPVTSEQVGFLYIRDIDERKKTELTLQERAERDALTGLYNRQTVESMIRTRLSRQHKDGALCALFIVDMDEFKQVNDRHGHYAGDKILEEVGRILREDSDGRSITGRLGGDEFLIFSDNISSEQRAEELAMALCKKLNVHYVTAGITLHTSASVGFVVVPCRDVDFKTMFQQADAALYDAKSRGKATYTCFGSNLQSKDSYIVEDSCIARHYIGEKCMIDHIDDSVLVIDDLSHDILFMNRVAQKLFNVNDYCGKKCYSILHGFSSPCVFCQSHLPGEEDFKAWENLNVKIQKRFMIRGKIINWDGKQARLEIFTDISTHKIRLSSKNKAERVLLDCAALLLITNPLETAVQGVLQHLGEFYQADRAYFAKTDDMNSIVISNADWRAPGIPVIEGENHRVESSPLNCWLEGLRKHRVIVFHLLDEMRELFPVKYAVLKEKGVTSFAAVALLDENGMVGYIGLENLRTNLDNITLLKSLSYFLHNEISKRRMQEQQLFIEEHDPLTGLLNWKSYARRFSQIHPEVISSMGVLVANVNHLRLLNQEYGAAYGDALLKNLARRLQENFPDNYIFRFAGDRFVALCQDITYKAFYAQTGKLQKEIDEEYPGSVAIGSSWSDEDIMPDRLLNCAEDHLSIIKEHKIGSLTADSRLRSIRLKRLTHALKNHNFQIYLQPKAQISSGKIHGVEALVRYHDEIHGVVPPIKFIPQLEAENSISYIDFFVLEEVCSLIRSWETRGFELFPVSLNFSRRTLMENNVVDKINSIVNQYNIDHSLIEIEITESTGDMERRALVEVSQKIIGSGYRLSLDDFGSEYSNISTLASLPLNGLKLDKSIINDLYSNPTTKLLVKNLINVCTEIGIESIAEGIEEEEQLEILRSFGCTYGQGYFYNKPIPVKDFERKYLKKT